MKVLSISDYHPTLRAWVESGGETQGFPSLTFLPKHLVENGHQFYWLIFDSVHRRWEMNDFSNGEKPNYAYPQQDLVDPLPEVEIRKEIRGIKVILQRLPLQPLFKFILVTPLKYLKIYGLLYAVLAAVKSLKLARELNPDLIYGQSPFVSALLAVLLKKPFIIRIYGTFLYPFLFPRYKRIKRLGSFLVFKLPSDCFIITNDGTRGDAVAQEMGVPEARYRFWINGIDKSWMRKLTPKENRTLRASHSLGLKDKLILSVCRLEDFKRVDRIISAFPSLLSDCPNAKLIIVGDGAQRAVLERMVESLGIGDHVRFTGRTPHSQVREYMQIADVLVSMNDLTNLVNPVLEAMICGKCFVTIDDGSLKGIISNAESGIFIAKPDLPDLLPRRVAELLNDDEKRNRLGRQAQQFAADHLWNWEERLNAELRLLESLASGQHGV